MGSELKAKPLKSGFTTGSCVTATAMAALESLLLDKEIKNVDLTVPSGDRLRLEVFEIHRNSNEASYGINKYSGDDPDVTNGALIISKVSLVDCETFNKFKSREKTVLLDEKLLLIGGEGVGLVTKPGLAASVGEPAVNPTPRAMILAALSKISDDLGYDGYIVSEIFIPKGRELAKRTFNGNLGIVGGISILGTSGIVAPMSEQALIDTIKVEMSVCRASGSETLVITPGNYGKDYLSENSTITDEITVKCSNFIGDALHFAGEMGFKKIVLSGHLGKLIKVSGGILNTHSKYGDGRMEILIDFCKQLGAEKNVTDEINKAVMVDEAMRIISDAGLKNEVMNLVVESIENIMAREIKKSNGNLDFQVGVIVFSNKYGLLGESHNIEKWFN